MEEAFVFVARSHTLTTLLGNACESLRRWIAADQAELDVHRKEAQVDGSGLQSDCDTCTSLAVSVLFYQDKLAEVEQERRTQPAIGHSAQRN